MTYKNMAEFLDIAKAATNTKTDSNLGRKLGVTRSLVYMWRKGSATPTDETMVQLAKRANLDPAEALILLNFLRSKGAVKSHYGELLKKFTAIIAIVTLFIFAPIANEAYAVESVTEILTSSPAPEDILRAENSGIINIMRFICTLQIRLVYEPNLLLCYHSLSRYQSNMLIELLARPSIGNPYSLCVVDIKPSLLDKHKCSLYVLILVLRIYATYTVNCESLYRF